MITWISFWPILLVPSALMTLVASVPTLRFNGKMLGGGLVREYYLNHIVLPLMPNDVGGRLVEWFASASVAQEWFFAFAVAINVNAALLPALYFFGCAVIGVSGWAARLRISQRRSSVR
jgi:hypothetical protein